MQESSMRNLGLDNVYNSAVWVFDKNGNNRREVARLELNESFVNTVAADDKYIYVAVLTLVDPKENPKKEIRQIEISTGKMVTLLEIGFMDYLFGAYDDSLVLLRTNVKEGTDGFIETIFAHTTYNVVSGKEDEFFSTQYASNQTIEDETANDALMMPYKENFYILSPNGNQTAKIVRLNIPDKSTDILYNELQYFSMDATNFIGFFDNLMVVSTIRQVDDDKRENCQFVFDINSNKLYETTLLMENYYEERIVPICGSVGNYFYVNYRYEEVPVTINDGNALIEVMMTVYKGALILKSDYWANKPNYETITDMVIV